MFKNRPLYDAITYMCGPFSNFSEQIEIIYQSNTRKIIRQRHDNFLAQYTKCADVELPIFLVFEVSRCAAKMYRFCSVNVRYILQLIN